MQLLTVCIIILGSFCSHCLDLCTRKSILTPVKTFRVEKTVTKAIDLSVYDFQYFLNELADKTPLFLQATTNYSTSGALAKVETFKSYPFYKEERIFKIKSELDKAEQTCDSYDGKFLTLYNPENFETVVNLLTHLNIDEVPCKTVVNYGSLYATSGTLITSFNDNTTTSQQKKAAVYPYITSDGDVRFPAKTSTPIDIFCLRVANPFDENSPRRDVWIENIQTFRNDLNSIKSIYENIQNVVNNLPIDRTNREVTRIKAKMDPAIQQVLNFVREHVTTKSLEKINSLGFERFLQVVPITQKFINFLKKAFKLGSMVNLDLGLLNLGIQGIASLTAKRQSTNELSLIGNVQAEDTDGQFEITIYRVIVIAIEPKKPRDGFLVKKGEQFHFEETYREFGLNCRIAEDSQEICKKYAFRPISKKSRNCASYLLGKSLDNTCDLEPTPKRILVRTDCYGNDTSIISASMEAQTYQLYCNDAFTRSLEIQSGVHRIRTACSIRTDEEILSPQVVKSASLESSLESIDDKSQHQTTGDLTQDFFKSESFWAYAGGFVIILLVTITVLILSIYACMNPAKVRKCCRRKKSRRNQDEDDDEEANRREMLLERLAYVPTAPPSIIESVSPIKRTSSKSTPQLST